MRLRSARLLLCLMLILLCATLVAAAGAADTPRAKQAFRERESENFRLRWSHPTDGILVEYAPAVLEKALKVLCATLNYRHTGGKITVEIYPDIASFAAASTLSEKEIETTGAVAICKFGRIMIASPRLYLQGYRWCDTLAHELAHYVIIKKTGDRVPVWLHEGIAKHCEELWRTNRKQSTLGPLHATLLAEAREQNRFITFQQMHPSLAKLDSQQEAALAFAEAVSFVQFLVQLKGSAAIADVLDKVAAGRNAEGALEEVAGMPFRKLHEKWLQSMRTGKLDRIPGLRLLPRKVAGGGDNTERTSDLSGMLPEAAYHYVRLGDMLREAGRSTAAAIEYAKATGQSGFISPHVHVRLARAQILSGSLDEAGRTLDNVGRYYEDYLPLHITRGELFLRQGKKALAAAALEEAIQINPFDPRPHAALMELYADPVLKAREERALRAVYEWLGP